jgi:predicted nucleotidyltransferase
MFFYYAKEIRALNKNKIRYLVVGGFAVNLHGVQRLTLDLDLMLDLTKEHLEKVIEVLGKLRYRTKVPRKLWEKASAIAFTHQKDEDQRIDIFLKNPIDFDVAYARRKTFVIDGLNIDCVSLDDLLELKNKADRVRDWLDIGALKRYKQLEKE